MQLNKAIITAAIRGFEQQKQEIDETIAELRAQLDGASTKPVPKVKVADAAPVKAKRTMSEKGKAAIRAALKKRWAAFHKADKPVAPKKTATKTATVKKAAPTKVAPKKAAPKKKLSAARKAALVANLAKARASKAAKKKAGEAVPF